MSLREYNRKRDFTQTAEPAGRKKKSGKALQFVIQRHSATRLHYDFRLEVEGALKSWAVPKGPSLNPADKRLAMMVEDHPMEYAAFSGTIPKGNYGAGEVEIWDKGTYNPLQEGKKVRSMSEQIREGSVKIVLAGKKLKGEFALVKMKQPGSENAWLLIKHRDEYAVDTPYDAENHTDAGSLVTKAEASRGRKKVVSTGRPATAANYQGAAGKKFQKYIKPMLAETSEKAFSDPDWLFEIKWDGYRAIGEVSQKTVRLYSRNGLDFSERYPAVAQALLELPLSCILDGEIVVLKSDGTPDFQTLQHFSDRDQSLFYYVFDLLMLDGKDTTGLPLTERKQLLKTLTDGNTRIVFSDHVEKVGEEFAKSVKARGLEGIMAKRRDSLYLKGSRSSNWLKIKNHTTDEAVIVGYTEPKGSRKHFGSLLLANLVGGKWKFAGHTGTGFSSTKIKELFDLFQSEIGDMPFERTPKVNAKATWLNPVFVAEIKHAGITREGMYRHPVFLRLRDDMNVPDIAAGTKIKKDKPKEIKDGLVTVGKHKVKLTNTDKIYWPGEGFTKGDLIGYYQQMSRFVLPYLKDRPLSLNRFPEGIGKPGFYHKDAAENVPDFVDSFEVYSESSDKLIDYIVCNNKATLAYINNAGTIEMNPWNSTTKHPENPDYMLIDLDPGDKNTFEDVIRLAQETHGLLGEIGVPGYAKTSGSSGIHIYIPAGARYSYEQVRMFTQLIAGHMEKRLPKLVTTIRDLKKRPKGRIYFDYLQNRRGQTLASAYCVRPVPGATVSMPLAWDEIKTGLSPKQFDITNAYDRVREKGDIFKPVLGRGVDLAKAVARLEEIMNEKQ